MVKEIAAQELLTIFFGSAEGRSSSADDAVKLLNSQGVPGGISRLDQIIARLHPEHIEVDSRGVVRMEFPDSRRAEIEAIFRPVGLEDPHL